MSRFLTEHLIYSLIECPQTITWDNSNMHYMLKRKNQKIMFFHNRVSTVAIGSRNNMQNHLMKNCRSALSFSLTLLSSFKVITIHHRTLAASPIHYSSSTNSPLWGGSPSLHCKKKPGQSPDIHELIIAEQAGNYELRDHPLAYLSSSWPEQLTEHLFLSQILGNQFVARTTPCPDTGLSFSYKHLTPLLVPYSLP